MQIHKDWPQEKTGRDQKSTARVISVPAAFSSIHSHRALQGRNRATESSQKVLISRQISTCAGTGEKGIA